MNYDIFLGGPWEKHAPFPYKSEIRKAFPDKRIFDPEVQPEQKTDKWFMKNLSALESCKSVVALVPDFPFPGIGPEVGFFYHKNCQGDFSKPLEEIVIIWPKTVKPEYGKKVAEKMGYVVENPEEAIARLKQIFLKY
jgi:hypothetical protein